MRNHIHQKTESTTIFRDRDFHSFVESLVKTIEVRDIYTAGHSKRVSEISVLICKGMDMPESVCEYIHIAGHLHDIGKIGIPDGILLKTGRLTDPEYILLQQHPVTGSSIFDKFSEFKAMSEIIRHHHERWDGLGYPDGLKGKEIPVGAAIISIADSFDAMTTLRSYRPSIKPEDALKEIIKNSGKQFSPEIVGVFAKIYKKKKNIIYTINHNYLPADRRQVYKSFSSIKTNIFKNELVNNLKKK